MFLLFLSVVLLIGFIINQEFFPKIEKKLFIPNSFILGSVISIPLIYFITAYISKSLILTIWYFLLVSVILLLYKLKISSLNHFKTLSFFLFLIFALLSFVIFDKSFSFDNKTDEFLIASNLYQDLGGHISYIRSLSIGSNYPFEIPFYSGGGISYYFMFDFYTAILENLGLRIDQSINLLSSISFASLVFYMYFLARKLFNNSFVGLFSVIFFIFPSNLSFINFIRQKGVTLNLPLDIWSNPFYINNAPFDGSLIFNFFNLNTFLNQRHLIMGIAIVLFMFLIIWFSTDKSINKKTAVFLGLILGLLFLWHAMMFLSLLVVLIGILVIRRSKNIVLILIIGQKLLFVIRRSRNLLLMLIIGGCLLLIQMLIMHFSSGNLISVRIGFLLENFNLITFLRFWILNLGVSIVLIFLGFLFSDKKNRYLFFVLSLIFIIPNLITFSIKFDFDNHKFFNLWIIFMNFFSAFALVKLFEKNFLIKALTVFLFLLFVISGIINNIVPKNDVYARIKDYKNNSLMLYALRYLPSDETILTNGEIYDPMSIIGKKTFIGRVHYLWVFGKEPSTRITDRKSILSLRDSIKARGLVHKNNIKYIVIYKNNFAKNQLPYNKKIYKVFNKIYEDNDGIIFKI